VDFIHQVEPYLTDAEGRAVAEYLGSGGWLTEFRKTREMEEAVCRLVKAPFGCMVTSGTVALYLALKALGVGPGDKVVVPNYTMIATANAVAWAGADLVLADVEEDTLCLNVSGLKPEPSWKALMYVAINGRHGDMEKVGEFCRTHGLAMVEDAAQALGARAGDRFLGTMGDLGIYSFTPHKIITTGQGGMVVTANPDLYAKVAKLKDFHRTAPATDWHDGLGFNFKFTDLQAVVGLEQIKTMEWRLNRKKEIFKLYSDRLRGVAGLGFPPTDLEECPPWFMDLVLPDESARDGLALFLKEQGIGSRPCYPPINHQVIYEGVQPKGSLPVSERMAYRILWLPSSLGLGEADIDRVCGAVRRFMEENQ